MKTMRAPKMDVVRFTESDVIVASGTNPIDTVRISGLGNGKFDDNYLSYGTTNLDLQDAYNHHVQFGSGFSNDGTEKTLADLVNDANSNSDGVNSNWNQTYNWDPSTELFVYRSPNYNNQ